LIFKEHKIGVTGPERSKKCLEFLLQRLQRFFCLLTDINCVFYVVGCTTIIPVQQRLIFRPISKILFISFTVDF
jgi:hypothetical protein